MIEQITLFDDALLGSQYDYNVPYKVDTTRERDCLKC